MMQNIKHHNASKLAGPEREAMGVCDHIDPWKWQDIERDRVGPKILGVGRPTANIHHRPRRGAGGKQSSVVILVDQAKRFLCLPSLAVLQKTRIENASAGDHLKSPSACARQIVPCGAVVDRRGNARFAYHHRYAPCSEQALL